uniref:Uncharacterized protein n=1 Tax=Avena sativa TaxID=4498 RepID=A0ACD6AD69_AVESA
MRVHATKSVPRQRARSPAPGLFFVKSVLHAHARQPIQRPRRHASCLILPRTQRPDPPSHPTSLARSDHQPACLFSNLQQPHPLARSHAMGCGFSSTTGRCALRPFAGVRVIHTNGYVEDFDAAADGTPVTVARATASSCGASSSSSGARYVLCSSSHLLQPGRAPFRPDDALEPGTVYFLLPHSVFQAESSAVDLACLMNRLTALARKGGGAAPAACPVDSLFAGRPESPQDDQAAAATKPLPPADVKSCAAAAKSSRVWRPQLSRIDESIGRSSRRSPASSCSTRSQD